MKKNPVLLAFSIFAAIGIIFVILGVLIGKAISIPEDRKATTTATITRIESYRDSDGDEGHDVWVQYEVKGQTYEEKLGSYSSSYRQGKKIDIIYDKENPTKINTPWGEKLFIGIFCGIGGLFAAIGIIGIIAVAVSKRKREKLEQTGTIIYAKYTGVELNRAIAVNGRNPYNIVCSWINPEDGKTYILKSENIYFDPEPVIQNLGLTEFPVFMDMENKKNYSVDITAIKNSTVDLR